MNKTAVFLMIGMVAVGAVTCRADTKTTVRDSIVGTRKVQ